MGISGWEARRIVERGEEVEGDDDIEDGGRVGKLMVEESGGPCSETEGRWVLAAAEFEVDVDVERSEGCDGEEDLWRRWLACGVDEERKERGGGLGKPSDWRRQGG